jgi:hypothetical protein
MRLIIERQKLVMSLGIPSLAIMYTQRRTPTNRYRSPSMSQKFNCFLLYFGLGFTCGVGTYDMGRSDQGSSFIPSKFPLA